MITINQLAERYVKLSLQIGQHSEYYIDAYYGPKAWRPEAPAATLAQLAKIASQLQADARQCIVADPSSLEAQYRMPFLQAHIDANLSYIEQLQGKKISFEQQCQALYDVQPPKFDESHFDQVLTQLEQLLPGNGPLNQRLDDYRQDFIVSIDKLDTVFSAAIDEARKRTLVHISLPEHESFKVELVDNQIWSAYNWYKGDSYSLIELNTDHPIFIDRVIDLAAHEGYPGHHVFNALMEKHLVNQKGWMEYCVYNLYSPCSLLAEGSANYGIEVAFPGQQRIDFEKQVLFPLAGIDADKAERYYQIQAVLHQLSYVDNMVAQRYLDGEIDHSQAVALLTQYALCSEARANQRLKFIEHNQAYVINYNYGQDLVEKYLAAKVGNGDHHQLWQAFAELLSNPMTGSMMQKNI